MSFLRINLLLCLCVCVSAHAKYTPGKLNEIDSSSERIMEVSLPDGRILSSAVLVYQNQGRWILPLGQLSEMIGVAITVWPSALGADGFILDESRPFHLDLQECEARYGGEKHAFECETALPHNEDIYAVDRVLAEWLPVDIEVNSFRSQVVLTPRELLPIQARLQREEEASRLWQGGESDPGYRRIPIPFHFFQLTTLDQQLQWTQNIPASGTPRLSGISSLSGEALGMQTLFTGSYNERLFTGHRLTLARRSAGAPFIPELKLRDVQLFNVDAPTVPLVAPVRPIIGAFLSSYPANRALNFDKTDLQGPLPLGWEVLLFRNNILVDRRVADTNGVYRFNDLPLQYGANRFKLVFFGPHGERREEYKNFIIDPSSQTKGGSDYRVFFGALAGTNQLLAGEYSVGVRKNLTALAGFYLEREGGQRHFSLGVIGLTERFLYSLRSAFSPENGSAVEVGTQTGIGTVMLGGKYTRLFNYRSRLFNDQPSAFQQVDQLEGNLYYIFPVGPGLALQSDFFRRSFEPKQSDLVFRNRLATTFGIFQVQTTVDWSPDTPRPLLGRTEGFYFPYGYRVRGALEYDFARLTAAELELQLVESDRYQIAAGLRQPFDGTDRQYQLQVSRLFSRLSIGAYVNAVLASSVAGGVQVAFSLLRDPTNGGLHMTRTPSSSYGSISIHAFLDENRNQIRDPGEPVASGMGFNVCGSERRYTDENGVLFVPGVAPLIPCDVAVAEAKNPNPFLRPAFPGVRVEPRAGTTAEIEVPIHVQGQIDGYVSIQTEGEPKPKRGIKMELLDPRGTVVQKTKSDADGFYAFEEVPAGQTYVVRVARDSLTRWGVHAEPESRTAKVAAEGSFEGGQDFLLMKQ